MYQGQAALLGAEVIKFCSVMQVEKQLLIILPLVLACLRNTLRGSWPGLSRMHKLEMHSHRVLKELRTLLRLQMVCVVSLLRKKLS